MGLLSNTGLLATVSKSSTSTSPKRKIEPEQIPELRCEVSPAPFMLRPYAGIYNPFKRNCSVLCNHPADTQAKDHVKRAKDPWEGRNLYGFAEDLSRIPEGQEKMRSPHDIVTEEMFRRYTETDSRPLTPAPTLASGKSRGSRRCLTPDQPLQKTVIVLDLRRSHSQETLYYHHGYTTSEMTNATAHTTNTNDRSTVPSLNLSEAAHNRLVKGPPEQLPPLASPLVLAKRTVPVKDTLNIRPTPPKKTQLKALNLGKPSAKGKAKPGTPGPPSTKSDKDTNDGSETAITVDDGVSIESRRRGKRRRKGRGGGSDRLTSAGLAAQSQQDPETQVAGIGTDSHNPSSRGSIATLHETDDVTLPVVKQTPVRKNTVSFLDDEILKFLHREVDEDAIETEFDTKRRYVLQEALRTRPDRSNNNVELQNLLRELKVPAVSLGDWLHIPRVFSRQNAQFSLPIDSEVLESLTPMQYASRYVTLQKSKQLLYLTVLRKFRPDGYRMPVENIEEGLILMMGGCLSKEQARSFATIMRWDDFDDTQEDPEDIKLTIPQVYRRSVVNEAGDSPEVEVKCIRYRTWCGLCAICERMYGRFPPRKDDPPNGIELSDFATIEIKLTTMKVDSGLVEILHNIRVR